MAMITCPECGREISDKAASCPHCGNPMNVLYEKPEANKIVVDNREEVLNYLTLARRARQSNNSEDASRYYDLVLQKEPNSWEAAFYHVYFTAMSCKIINIVGAANDVANCLDIVFSLIKNYEEEDQQHAACEDIITSSATIATMLASAAKNHYNPQIEGSSGECSQRVVAANGIYVFANEAVKKYFASDDILRHDIAKLWLVFVSANTPTWLDAEWANRRVEELTPVIQKTEPSYEKPGPFVKSGCYVATCVYGSYDCPQVWTLRRFRDDTLASSRRGRAFIKLYYATSPTLVCWFGDTAWFKALCKKPIDRLVKRLREEGVEDTPYRDKNW